MNDLTIREKIVSASMVIAIVWLGLFPKPVLNTAKPAILKTLKNQKEITFKLVPPNPPKGGLKPKLISVSPLGDLGVKKTRIEIFYNQASFTLNPPLEGEGG